MIQQLFFFFSLLISFALFPSCTIFDSGDLEEGAEEEDYYEGEEDGSGFEGEEKASDSIEDEGQPIDEEEDVYYIDEEDEDFVAEEEGPIEVEDVASDDLRTDEKTDSTEYNTAEDSSSFFASDSASGSGSGGKAATSPVEKKRISYKKIKTQPYQAGGFLVNAVYIARQGEDIQSVSNKIFGSDQVSQLYSINPHLKARSVKVGNKIYYQSPVRPQDSSQLLFYFEDNGMQPEYYQVQAGQNIRKVASQLLGHANSWKEIWATNSDLDSKGIVDSSITIRYWLEGVSAPPPSVSEPESVPEEGETFPEGEAEEQPSQPPPPPAPQEGEDSPPEPSSQGPSDDYSSSKNLIDRIGMDAMIGIVLVLVAILIAIVIVKRRKKKKDFDYTATSFEIDE